MNTTTRHGTTRRKWLAGLVGGMALRLCGTSSWLFVENERERWIKKMVRFSAAYGASFDDLRRWMQVTKEGGPVPQAPVRATTREPRTKATIVRPGVILLCLLLQTSCGVVRDYYDLWFVVPENPFRSTSPLVRGTEQK